MDHVLNATLIAVGVMVVVSAGVKAKHLGVFLEVLKDSIRIMELYCSIVDKAECRWRLVL